MKNWKPSKSARREFAIRMQDPIENKAYEDRKSAKADRRRSTSKFDYNSAGGNYIPTKIQADEAFKFSLEELTNIQRNACNAVLSAYSLNEKVNHDDIHIVNEIIRTK